MSGSEVGEASCGLCCVHVFRLYLWGEEVKRDE